MSASKLQEKEVRIGHSLNKKEEEFVIKRRETVFQSLQKLNIPCSQDAVPHIALLGSGGGQRAMVGLLGSLVQLDKAGLLDCILYLSGVSGSTWCMASLYQEPDWSTKLETVKDRIVERIKGPQVSLTDAMAKLKKYYYGKDFFSLTDLWAAVVVTAYVKEIDEHTLTDQWDHKNPFPIYTVIDKQCKQSIKEKDPWFEISPHEAGYSLTGAFVETCNFGSQFDNGSKKKHQPEMDMLYLQALCGSALADGKEIKKFLLEKIKEFFKHLLPTIQTEMFEEMRKVCSCLFSSKDPKAPPVEKCFQVLMDLMDMNLSVLNVKDPSALDQSIRTTLNKLGGGKHQLIFPIEKLNLADKQAAKRYMKQHTEDVCNNLMKLYGHWFVQCIKNEPMARQRSCMSLWRRSPPKPAKACQSLETRDYEDAGLLLNSPFFSVLRKERNTDLIISLDFSKSDPFTTVKQTAEMCKKLKIPFPEVNIPSEDLEKPKDFYVFKGQNAPTVIHIPLFNVVNCGDDIKTWRKKYHTFQDSYSAEKITDLMEVAGKNISNNREKLKEQIAAAVGKKAHN
uniref:Cytosolic phospholipase A2 gamma-like n=1 Tax=Sinocyclocheilus anshuiensis TaxID=1608454 RepID=A0A671L8U5_9TELE